MSTVARLAITTLLLVAMSATDSASAQTRRTVPLSIRDVQSFNYFIAPGFNGAPRGGEQYRLAASEEYDLLIANYYVGHDSIDPAMVREFQDSSPRGRLAIAYINAGEFMRCCSNIDRADQDRWFDAAGELTAAAPAWLGPRNPKFKNLWSVREWDSKWQKFLLGEIDRIAALGFDGVFLDMLYSDSTWGPKGFAAGKAGIVDYRSSQKGLAKLIWYHVRDDLNKPRFVIIANYSSVQDDNIPALTEGLSYADAFMKESEYFGRDNSPAPWVGSRPIGPYFEARYAKFYAAMLRRHKVVLLQNYNLSFENEALVVAECARYGYLASNTHFPQNLIHIDGLPSCNEQTCSLATAARQHASFPRSSLMH